MAGWTGGGTATLVHQSYCDSCQFCLVPKRLHKVEVAPLPQAEVLQSTGIPVGYAREVTHHQDPNPVPQGEGDDLLGGLVMGLVDTTAMARLGATQAKPVAAPTPRAMLPRLGCPSGGLGAAGLLILKVQVAFGPQSPTRHQQPLILGDDRIRMNDPKVHPRHPIRIQVAVMLDGDGGGDSQPQPPAVDQQRDRPDLLGRIGERPGQPNPQLGLALGDRQAHPLTLDGEGAVVEPDGDKGPLAPREAGVLLLLVVALGGLEPGVGIAAQHRPCPHRRQLPEVAHAGELAAQGLIAVHG